MEFLYTRTVARQLLWNSVSGMIWYSRAFRVALIVIFAVTLLASGEAQARQRWPWTMRRIISGVSAANGLGSPSLALDTAVVQLKNAPFPIEILPPQGPISCGLDSSVTHPSIVYFPNGWNGKRYWMGLTQDSRCNHEAAFIRVSNDACCWERFVGAQGGPNDSCPDPLFRNDELIDSAKGPSAYADYVSDLTLFFGTDGKLWGMARGTWQYTDTGRTASGRDVQFSALYVKSSSNGYTWSRAVRCTPVTYSSGYPWGVATLMSPAVWVLPHGGYGMLAVDGCKLVADSGRWSNANRLRGTINRVLRYEAARPDTIWRLVDTVRQSGLAGPNNLFPTGPTTSGFAWEADDSIGSHRYVPWHINVVGQGSDSLMILLTAVSHNSPARVGTEIPTYTNFVGYSTDGGRSMIMRFEPLLIPSPDSSAFDHQYVYRMAGWWEEDQSERRFRLLYGGFNSTKSTDWHVGLTEMRVPTSLAHRTGRR
jgi:hypothetical protein